jgi:hypothetical protein
MDDFLHNLRSGKLKQPDRGKRDYTDYKGPQRRAPNERRRTDYYAKVTNENFALVKDSLDILAQNQKRYADAMEVGNISTSRIADALEAIASMMRAHWGFGDLMEQPDESMGLPPEEQIIDPPVEAENGDRLGDIGSGGGKLNHADKPRLLNAIAAMRAEGDSWEKIARQLDDQAIPTLSGKGKWRGTAIKKFWDINTEASGS